MIKIIGVCLVAAAGLLCVREKLHDSIGRENELRGIMCALKALKSELEINMSPIAQALESAARKCDSESGAFLLTAAELCTYLGDLEFSAVWTSCIDKALHMLTQEEKAQLNALGRVLGRFSLNDELKELAKCIETLESDYRNFSEKRENENKLYVEKIAAFCTMIVIVFV